MLLKSIGVVGQQQKLPLRLLPMTMRSRIPSVFDCSDGCRMTRSKRLPVASRYTAIIHYSSNHYLLCRQSYPLNRNRRSRPVQVLEPHPELRKSYCKICFRAYRYFSFKSLKRILSSTESLSNSPSFSGAIIFKMSYQLRVVNIR